jgi:hypothetical protein
MTGNSSEREARLARALRENLKRRKARDRALVGDDVPPAEEDAQERPNKAGNGH